MKILVIGNSFGTDATRYLYGVARANKTNLKVVNLYIGGCSLYRHYRNMLSEEAAYSYEINGITSGLFVSIKDALLSDEWDVVTLQQCSPDSDKKGSYEPYLSELAAYVRRHAPKAKLWIHETWTFEHDHPRFLKTASTSPEEMLPKIQANYRDAAERIGATGIIPSGEAMYRYYTAMRANGKTMYRDGFHAGLGSGRYLLACVWYSTLCKKSVIGNTFRDFDVETSEEDVLLAQKIANEVVSERIG